MQSNNEALQSLPSDTRLAGRTAIVTGSSGGIGEAIAHVLAASGAEVVSDEASYAHGTVLDIDGGIATTRLG